MNELQIFQNKEFGEVRSLVINNEPWFVGKDVAEALGYKDVNHAILDHVDEEDKVNSKTQGQNAPELGQRGSWLINESGLYSLILSSKLPNAKKFKRWVTNEVLPSIRKHGAYMSEEVINKTLDDPDFIIEMATKLKYEREQRRLLEEKAKHLEATITIDKPYTNFGKSIATSSDAITIGQFAKVLNNNNINIGRNRLFTILRDNGYLIKVGKDKNMPKQIYVKQGLFKVAESIVKTVKGELLTATTLITGKGQMYFLEIFSNLTENKTYIS